MKSKTPMEIIVAPEPFTEDKAVDEGKQIELPNLCPECGKPMTSAGKRWSGRHRKQSYACRTTTGCGRVTFSPVHTFQNSLFGAKNDHAPPRDPPPANKTTKVSQSRAK
jgi:hypothetical protein